MIRSNQTLLKISVDLDPKNEQGGTAIAGAMRINTTITDLNLGAPGAPWPMDAATRAEVDNTLRINKFLRGVDSDANVSSAAPMTATATRFPPAAPAVAAAAAASQHAPILTKETAASVLSSPPAVPTASSTPADATAPQSLQSQPVSHSSSTGGATSFGEGADSPGSMLDLLRRKLDAFQGTESSSMRASAAPAAFSAPYTAASAAGAPAQPAPAPMPTSVQNPPASAPAPHPSLAAAVGSAGSTAMAEPNETNESVLTPSPATTGIMVSADELQQLHERVRAPHRLLREFTRKACICLLACCPILHRSREHSMQPWQGVHASSH